MSKKKILVTGGCGYIGSHTIIEMLMQTDFEVVSIDSLINSSIHTLERIRQITGKSIKNYQTDLCNLAEVEKVFDENTDFVGIIHFAALKSVPDSVAQPLHYYHNNINSLLNLLKCCAKYGVNNFIFSSSCSVYGNVAKLPVNEQTPLSIAESPYAYTKQIGENIIKDFIKNQAQTKAIALRYFNPVGAHTSGLNGENPINKPTSLVPVITQTAIGIIKEMSVFGEDYDTRDGSCVRDYIHVTDIAEAHIKALAYLLEGKNEANYEVINLGTGNGVTVLEAIHAFEKVSGVKLNYKMKGRRDGDVAAIYSDTTMSEQKLGWKTSIGIEEMMSSAWKWQQLLKDEQAK
ncbi:MAG: UDP-glucose 4-epimerase GalE [Cytophagales bacterium]|nr:MAG: UDP-glucose 4-epimerase GalE [Cytophagales bacterium]